MEQAETDFAKQNKKKYCEKRTSKKDLHSAIPATKGNDVAAEKARPRLAV